MHYTAPPIQSLCTSTLQSLFYNYEIESNYKLFQWAIYIVSAFQKMNWKWSAPTMLFGTMTGQNKITFLTSVITKANYINNEIPREQPRVAQVSLVWQFVRDLPWLSVQPLSAMSWNCCILSWTWTILPDMRATTLVLPHTLCPSTADTLYTSTKHYWL